MREDAHERARRLIERDPVEGIAPAEREWLDGHLDVCEGCAGFERLTVEAIRTVRSVSVSAPPDLAWRAQFRVHLRAQERRAQEHGWALWVSFALSWILGIASAPLVWRALEWIGGAAGIPSLWLKLGIGLWWGAPAAIAAGIWALERRRTAER